MVQSGSLERTNDHRKSFHGNCRQGQDRAIDGNILTVTHQFADNHSWQSTKHYRVAACYLSLQFVRHGKDCNEDICHNHVDDQLVC